MLELICFTAALISLSFITGVVIHDAVGGMQRASEPDLEFKATHILAVTPGTKMEVMLVDDQVLYQPPLAVDPTADIIGLGIVEDFPGILFPLEDK